jgi:hypothetical protein
MSGHCAPKCGEHLAQVATNNRTVGNSQRLPSLFETVPSHELHIYVDFLLIYSPSVDFWDWYAVTKRFLDHPQALGFYNGDMRAKFDQKAKLWELDWWWLSFVAAWLG